MIQVSTVILLWQFSLSDTKPLKLHLSFSFMRVSLACVPPASTFVSILPFPPDLDVTADFFVVVVVSLVFPSPLSAVIIMHVIIQSNIVKVSHTSLTILRRLPIRSIAIFAIHRRSHVAALIFRVESHAWTAPAIRGLLSALTCEISIFFYQLN